MNKREFLKSSAIISAGSLFTSGTFASQNKKNVDLFDETFHINPAFRMTLMDDASVKLSTTTGDGQLLSHSFTGNEALTLRALNDNTALEVLVEKQNTLSSDECKKILNELEENGIIYSGELIKGKIMNKTNE